MMKFSVAGCLVSISLNACGLVALANPQGLEQISPVSLPNLRLKPYTCQAAGVTLSYPFDWTVTANPDKDTELKIAARPDGDLHGEIALNRFPDTASEEDVASLLEHSYFEKLAGYKKLADQHVIFGRQNLHGLSQTFTARINGLDIWQRRIYFRSEDSNVLVLSFTSSSEEGSRLQLVSNNIMASVTTGHSQNLPAGSPATSALSFATFTSKAPGVSFVYPSDWKLGGGDANAIVSFSGLNRVGQLGSITLSAVPATYQSAEDVGHAIENDLIQNPEIKDYRTLHDDSQDFGAATNLRGYVAESTFRYQGQPATQLAGYFNAQNRHYILAVRGFNWSPNELHSLFARITGSIKTVD